MSQLLEKIKSFPWKSTERKIYLNWCGAERIRGDVIAIEDRFRKWQHQYEDDPKGCLLTLREAISRSRRIISKILNCRNQEHILFTTGSEESLKSVLFSHQIIPYGSRILATDCEFFGIYNKISKPRYRTDIAQIWAKTSKNDIIKEIVDNIFPDTKLLLISHVCYNSGIALPIEEICQKVKTKNPATFVLVDGAQAVGQIPVDLETLGCDFYAGDGHKWLVGPDQTGFLYIRSAEHLKTIAKDMCSAMAVHPNLNHNKGSRSGAIAFELAALGEALLPFATDNHLLTMQQHNRTLAAIFRNLIEEKLSPYFSITPQIDFDNPTSTVSITLTNPENSTETLAHIHDDLLKEKIHCAIIKTIPEEFNTQIQIPPLLRFCFHFWNEEEEIDIVIKKLLLLAKRYELPQSEII